MWPTQQGQAELGLGAAIPHLARFSVTLLKASCFLARFLAAASLAIFSPSRSLRPGSKIYKHNRCEEWFVPVLTLSQVSPYLEGQSLWVPGSPFGTSQSQ